TARRLLADGAIAEGIVEVKEAVALRRGELLSDDPYGEWLAADRARIEQIHSRILVDAAAAAADANLLYDALDLGLETLRHDPSTERAARTVMAVSARVGDIAGAVRAFNELKRHLAEE